MTKASGNDKWHPSVRENTVSKFHRTFRGHTISEGIVGPGWTLDYSDYLEFSRSTGFRWCLGDARITDFVYGADVPRGLQDFVGTDNGAECEYTAYPSRQCSDGSLRTFFSRGPSRAPDSISTDQSSVMSRV
jgi:hypothetical protein